MAKIILDSGVVDKSDIDVSECTHPSGHCFGSDGGSGVPDNLKVSSGRGGEKEVWELDAKKEKINKKEIYNQCQFCLKYTYVKDKDETVQTDQIA